MRTSFSNLHVLRVYVQYIFRFILHMHIRVQSRSLHIRYTHARTYRRIHKEYTYISVYVYFIISTRRMAQQMREQMNEQSEILELLQLVVEQLNNQASITTMIFPKAAGMNGTTLTSLAPSSRSSSSSSSQNKSSKMMFKSSSASSFPTLAEALTSGSPRSTGGRNDSIDYSKSEFIDEVVASKFDVGSPPAYLQPGFKPPLRRMFSKGKLKRSASDKDTRDHGQKRSSAMNRRASAAQLADAESFMSSMRKSTIGGHDSSHSSSGGEPAPMSRSVTIDPTFSGMVGRNKGRGSGKKKARKETQSQLQRVKSLKTTADKLRRLQTLKMREKENIQKEKHPHAQTQSLHHTHERRDLQKENSVSSNIGMVLHAQGREMGSLSLSQGQAALSNWNNSVSAARAVKKLKKRSRKKEGKNKKHGNNSSRSASRNISRTSSRTLSRAPSKMV